MRFISDDRKVDSGSKKQFEVIAAGLPRCATSSMQEALESEWLGCGPSMHMAHVVPWPERSQVVIDALREPDREKRLKIVAKLFTGYGATCDFPGAAFTDELMDLYPNAKIILNQRESPEVWAQSLGDSLMFFNTWTYRITTFLWKTDRYHAQMQLSAFPFFSKKLGSTSDLRLAENHVEFYSKYNDFVRTEAKKRGMPVLEWQPQDGWKPICDFLGKPLPPATVPFPRTNERRQMQILKAFLVGRGVLAWAALGGAVYAGVTFGPRLVKLVLG